jgi:L-alanine-DL-glutamate epimerase-like enolase superfamily enzyme
MIYGESPESIVTAITRWFAPRLVGLDVMRTEAVWPAMAHVVGNHTAKGALDLAIHDLQARLLGLPCAVLLGGWERTARVTHLLGLGEPSAVAEEAAAARAEYGFTAFKLKAGLNPSRDIAMCRSVREAVGPTVLLYVDVNHGYQAETALATLRAYADYDIAWVEEPCPADDRAGRRRVAAESPVPILGDESCTSLAETARELEDGTCRLVSIKVARTGYAHSRRILGLCEGLGARPLIGSQGDSGLGTLASLHFCVAHRATHALPAELSYFLTLADDLLAEPLRISDGRLTLPEGSGLGVSLDETKVAHYRIDH